MLLAYPLQPGAKLTIDDFCIRYDLAEVIRDKLKDNEYTGSHEFQHIEINDLKEMRFLTGHIAGLKEAVRMWASSAEE